MHGNYILTPHNWRYPHPGEISDNSLSSDFIATYDTSTIDIAKSSSTGNVNLSSDRPTVHPFSNQDRSSEIDPEEVDELKTFLRLFDEFYSCDLAQHQDSMHQEGITLADLHATRQSFWQEIGISSAQFDSLRAAQHFFIKAIAHSRASQEEDTA